jgi:hypothetical protein
MQDRPALLSFAQRGLWLRLAVAAVAIALVWATIFVLLQ